MNILKRKKLSLLLALILVVSSLAACGKSDTASQAPNAGQNASQDGEKSGKNGTIRIGQTWVIGALDPTDSSVPWGLTSHGVSEGFYMLDENGHLYSRFIKELKQTSDTSWDTILNEDVKFSDGSAVDAKALSDAMNAIQEKNELSNATVGKITFTPKGDYELEIKSERPTMTMDSVLAEWTNVVFKQDGDKFIFTGPYMVASMEPENKIELTPNPYYPDADKRQDVELRAFKDVTALKLAFESGDIDMAFTVTPDVAELLKKDGKMVKSIPAGYQYFGMCNLKDGALKDPKVREALNYGLNRQDYLDVLKGGKIETGLFASYYDFAGKEKLTYDKEKAMKILEEAGYKKNKDNIYEKDGKPLNIRLVTYTSRPDLGLIVQVMTSQLKDLGIKAESQVVDDIDQFKKSGQFDLMVYAQHTAPTGEPSFFLNQFFRTNEPNNTMGYSNPKVDKLLDQFGSEKDQAKRNEIAQEIQHIIYEDAPVLFLVDPEWHIAVSDKLKDYEPYGGDYYIVNAKLGL